MEIPTGLFLPRGGKIPILVETRQSMIDKTDCNFKNRALLSTFVKVGMIIVFALSTFVVIFLLSYKDELLIGVLLAIVPFAIILFNYPFIGLLIIIAMIPLESAFLSLYGGALTVTRLVGLFVFCGWAIGMFVKHQKIKLFSSMKWIVAFSTWAGLSFFWAVYTEEVVVRIQTLIQLIALAILVVNEINSIHRLKIVLTILVISCLLAALLGVTGIAVDRSSFLLTLENQGAKEYTAYIGMVILLASIYFSFGGKLQKVLSLGAALICVFPLFAGGERGIILALGLSTVTVLALSQYKTRLLAIVPLVIIFLYFSFQFMGRSNLISQVVVQRFSINSVLESGGSNRFDIWKVGLVLVKHNPVMGVGLNNFPNRFADYVPPTVLNKHLRPGRDPHNDLLGITGDLGFIGLFLYLGLLTSTCMPLIRLFFKHIRPEAHLYATIILGLMIYCLGVGLTSTFMWRKIFWLALALTSITPDILASTWPAFTVIKGDHGQSS
jgi:O-antigen ligase